MVSTHASDVEGRRIRARPLAAISIVGATLLGATSGCGFDTEGTGSGPASTLGTGDGGGLGDDGAEASAGPADGGNAEAASTGGDGDPPPYDDETNDAADSDESAGGTPPGSSTGEVPEPGGSTGGDGAGDPGPALPPGDQPYRPCPAGDGDCLAGETCFAATYGGATFSVCWGPCLFSLECPLARDATADAWPVCSSAHAQCVLDCSLGQACPAAMACVPFEYAGFPVGRCMWPD